MSYPSFIFTKSVICILSGEVESKIMVSDSNPFSILKYSSTGGVAF